ncbi:MAG: DVU0772 family protein [Thermodesulfovibrionales bacterium]
MDIPEIDDKSFFDLLGLKDIRKRPDILPKIKLDVTPQMMMEPRFQSRPEDLEKLKDITGYMFYIETESETPALMLLKIGRSDITNTVGKIEEIPSEMIQKAVAQPLLPPVCGMYAITEEIKDWLKKELSV